MKKILNLTQHVATPEQVAAGVVEPDNKALAQKMLTFDSLPSAPEIEFRARSLAALAHGYEMAMIGGAPYLMAPLEAVLHRIGVEPVYAFSKRESVEEVQPDGSIKKTQVFRHAGFIEVPFPST